MPKFGTSFSILTSLLKILRGGGHFDPTPRLPFSKKPKVGRVKIYFRDLHELIVFLQLFTPLRSFVGSPLAMRANNVVALSISMSRSTMEGRRRSHVCKFNADLCATVSSSMEFTLIPFLKNFLISNESRAKQDNRKPWCGLSLFGSEVATATLRAFECFAHVTFY